MVSYAEGMAESELKGLVSPGVPLTTGDIATTVFKETNPKDAVGTKKAPASTVSQAVMAEVGVGMLEGARKYGRHNYRVAGVRASIYYDATRRHLDYWWEGEDVDPDSGLSHITKAICSLVVLRDAMIQDMVTDDRPPSTPEWHKKWLQERVNEVFDRYPTSVQAYVKGDTELHK